VLKTPTLDERGADKGLLAQIFLRRAHPQARFAPDALGWITARAWPGNVRELRSAMECAAALASGTTITQDDLAFATGGASSAKPETSSRQMLTLEQEVAALERLRIQEALERSGNNHTHTARDLGLSRVGLLKKMDRMGLR
jgi:DNA-binding NtrC family response regulator